MSHHRPSFAAIQFAFLTAISTISGIECHSEHHHHEHLRHLQSTTRCDTTDPGKAGEDAIITAVAAFRETPRAQRTSLPIVVPVCFHTLYAAGGAPLTDEKLQSTLNHLNQAFTSSSCCDRALEWCTSEIVDKLCSTETQITFEFAELVGGVVTGDTTVGTSVTALNACVVRTENGDWFTHSKSIDEAPMKDALHLGDRRVLNAYFVDFPNGSLGYATFPFNDNGKLDGVVVGFDTLPGDGGRFGEGDTLVHEVGHWLGLPHTFSGGCFASDGVLDTAKTRDPYNGCTPQLSRPDSCPTSTGADPIFNFMDYSDDVCMYEFTTGQKETMLAMWEFYRLGDGGIAADEIIQLQLGVPSNPIDLFPREKQLYKLPTSTCEVTCTLSGDKEGDVDLFVEYDQVPQYNDGDSCVSESGGNTESCRLQSSGRSLVPLGCRNRSRRQCNDLTVDAIYVGIQGYGISTAKSLVVTCSRNA
ncbi:hypothetical protein FisN_33Hh050 [Fistulifera solaris]|uniref:Peptidase M43 pregnancy-associated plasma-A domain-containing protein n=1 Tax=Fistulifera solaris TaxID=1519565 RepID=A0A1Z5KRE6_FISSO|nr:hypothetical protein FisN_33Hh050 [Fistulifera solaris]|eukprot:GAX28675.1 hypothetical protein FisN_33Hh050 [Fistulifera solaris]